MKTFAVSIWGKVSGSRDPAGPVYRMIDVAGKEIGALCIDRRPRCIPKWRGCGIYRTSLPRNGFFPLRNTRRVGLETAKFHLTDRGRPGGKPTAVA